jgi:hypothetical protein
VARHEAGPDALEQANVERFAKAAGELLNVEPGLRRAQALVHHTLLKSGQRITTFGHLAFLARAPEVRIGASAALSRGIEI